MRPGMLRQMECRTAGLPMCLSRAAADLARLLRHTSMEKDCLPVYSSRGLSNNKKTARIATLLAPYSEYARAGQIRRAVLPGAAAGAHMHGEDLLAGPQLQRLEQRRLRQLHGVQRIAHLGHELPNLPAAEEAVLACEQEAGRQEVLQAQAHTGFA